MKRLMLLLVLLFILANAVPVAAQEAAWNSSFHDTIISPNGEFIALIRGTHDVLVGKSDGTDIKQLNIDFAGDGRAEIVSWSPNSEMLAIDQSAPRSRVYVVNLNGDIVFQHKNQTSVCGGILTFRGWEKNSLGFIISSISHVGYSSASSPGSCIYYSNLYSFEHERYIYSGIGKVIYWDWNEDILVSEHRTYYSPNSEYSFRYKVYNLREEEVNTLKVDNQQGCAFSGTNFLVACFQLEAPGTYLIQVFDLDENNKLVHSQLTEVISEVRFPFWSPNGSYLVLNPYFSPPSMRRLKIISFDQDTPSFLETPFEDGRYFWMPDGANLLVEVKLDTVDEYEHFIYNIKTGETTSFPHYLND